MPFANFLVGREIVHENSILKQFDKALAIGGDGEIVYADVVPLMVEVVD